MNLRQFLLILRLRWWLVLLVFLLAMGLAVAATYLLPKRFSAEAAVISDVRADPLLATYAPQFASPAHMATQVEIIKSDRVARRVVKLLNLAQSPQAVEQWREETGGRIPLEAYFGSFLQKGLVVDAGRGSNVLTIKYTSPSAAFAAAAANAFVKAFLDVSGELRVEPARQTSTFYDERVKALLSDLEAAQQRLSSYERSKGIIITPDRVDLEGDKLQSLQAQLAAAQLEMVDASSRRANAGTDTSVDVQQSAAVQGLRTELARLEAKISEVSEVQGSNHPARVALEAQAAQVRKQIATEMKRVSGTTSTVSRISGQKLAELRAMVDAQKKLVLNLRSDRDEAMVLRTNVETAQKAYEAVASRRSQLALETQADQAGARVLSPAVEPIEPTSPVLSKNLIAGAALGLLLGFGLALLVELRDRRVRGNNDLLALEGIPLLAVISAKPGKFELPRAVPALPMQVRERLTMDGGLQ